MPISHWIFCFKNFYVQKVYIDLFILVLSHLKLFYFTLLNHIAWLMYECIYGSHWIFYCISNFNIESGNNYLFISVLFYFDFVVFHFTHITFVLAFCWDVVHIVYRDHSGRLLALIANAWELLFYCTILKQCFLALTLPTLTLIDFNGCTVEMCEWTNMFMCFVM